MRNIERRANFFLFVPYVLFVLFGLPLHAAETNSPAKPAPAPVEAPAANDLSSFDLISSRNIFNPNRAPHSHTAKGSQPRPSRVDSFTLVGTMDYDKGWFAFFDGTGSEYRKPMKPGDLIGGYRIGQIASDSITLLAASNKTIRLPVGAQMKRSDNGPWVLMKHAEPVNSPKPGEPADFSSKAANLNGVESDALKRLLLKRQNEK